ncbi:hypothetical protein D3OALGB2SA_3579 [Olavius algarvensis associated proteobacterium Delta 3]|nr:hypothetical protein D3OALGB2SA_3579 [Olavius algarvensis associated proteobacterium Delta 3]
MAGLLTSTQRDISSNGRFPEMFRCRHKPQREEMPPTDHTYDALRMIRNDIPRLASALGLEKLPGMAEWTGLVDGKLLPRVSPDFPVVVAICGGGSSGKSTLFNSLAGAHLSPTGGSAGMNRRLLVAGHPDTMAREDFLPVMFESFRETPDSLTSPEELKTPGLPLMTTSTRLPPNLVMLDTPDFDTGAGGRYANREVTRQALEASDVVVYIFTNSNYHNLDNTDFISRMLTGIGQRRSVLVYRVYPSFSDDEVRAHARLVSRNIYGENARRYILGVYRADEENTVAAGDRFLQLHPVADPPVSLEDMLTAIDPKQERGELIQSMLTDALDRAERLVEQCRNSREELALYLDALQTAQSHCVHETLKHFPMDMVMKRFADIWLAGDPAHIKAMRRTGSIVEWPLKLIMRGAKLAKYGVSGSDSNPETMNEIRLKVEEDLLEAVNSLYSRAVSSEITVTTTATDPVGERLRLGVERVRSFRRVSETEVPRLDVLENRGQCTVTVAAPRSVAGMQERLRAGNWQAVITDILSRKESILAATPEIDRELEQLAGKFRDRMSIWGQIRQTFSALLNVLPATAAVTYVLHTGDPMGAAGIKVKLTGLFGLHDLYALVAIPATSGLKRADQLQLEEMLAPIARLWLERKLKTVQNIFEDAITGDILEGARHTLEVTETLIDGLDRAIHGAREEQ